MVDFLKELQHFFSVYFTPLEKLLKEIIMNTGIQTEQITESENFGCAQSLMGFLSQSCPLKSQKSK